MLSVEDALEAILSCVRELGTEKTALCNCLDRILAGDISADGDLPPFDNSAMDGYAVRSDDTSGASAQSPRVLAVVASEPAGTVTSRAVLPGTAVRIMTGAMMPAGADAVVPVEDTQARQESVAILRAAAPGANVRISGEDVKRGQLVLRGGTRVGPAEMGMLAALGRPEVWVFRKPRVAILTTGSEIVDADKAPGLGQIRDSNSYSLLGQVLRMGAEVSVLDRVSDEREQLARGVHRAAEMADVVITSGGVSVGDCDLVKETLAELGDMRFWRVAIKPGKPLVFGLVLGRPLFGLPGNPVSSMVTFDLFVQPALLKMAGITRVERRAVSGVLSQDVKHKEGRREFVRAVTTWRGSGYAATPTGEQGSGRLSSMLGANSYVVMPESVGNAGAGSAVDIILLD